MKSVQLIGGIASNTDRYTAIKLHKEFEHACTDLEINEELDKSQLFEVFVKLGYLKPV